MAHSAHSISAVALGCASSSDCSQTVAASAVAVGEVRIAVAVGGVAVSAIRFVVCETIGVGT